jgi:hypothetical protein
LLFALFSLFSVKCIQPSLDLDFIDRKELNVNLKRIIKELREIIEK